MDYNLEGLVMVVLGKGVSGIENMMKIESTTMYKGIVKKEFRHFKTMFKELSRGLYKLYYDSNPKIFEIMVTDFEGFYYEGLKSDKHVNMVMFYAKMESIKQDLKKIKFEDNNDIHVFFAIPLIKLIDRVLGLKLWNNYLPDHINPFVHSITKYGERIYLQKEEKKLIKKA